MANPKPSLIQCLVLHEIADDDVWFDLATGKWHSTYVKGVVSTQVDILHRDGYIDIVDYVVSLTDKGREAMRRRSVAEILDRLNR